MFEQACMGDDPEIDDLRLETEGYNPEVTPTKEPYIRYWGDRIALGLASTSSDHHIDFPGDISSE